MSFLRNMEYGSSHKPERKSRCCRNSKCNPLAIPLSTVLHSSHRSELLLSLLCSIRVAFDKLHGLEAADSYALSSIANTIDSSKPFLLHHACRDLLLSSLQDQGSDRANDQTEDDDATNGERDEQRTAHVSARSVLSFVSFDFTCLVPSATYE